MNLDADHVLPQLFARTTTPRPDCMVWNGDTERGYGRLRLPDHSWARVHRLVWELTNGPILEGLELDHLCRVRACINVEHLELVTPDENKLRARPFRQSPMRFTPPPPPPPWPTSRNPFREGSCRNGHPYTDETPPVPGATYRCKTCRRESDKQSKRRRRAAAKAAGLRLTRPQAVEAPLTASAPPACGLP